MNIKIIFIVCTLFIFMGKVSAATVYAPTYEVIEKFRITEGDLFIFMNGSTEIDPGGCNQAGYENGYAVTKIKSDLTNNEHYAESYTALLAAFYNKSTVRVAVEDSIAECFGAKPRVKLFVVQ